MKEFVFFLTLIGDPVKAMKGYNSRSPKDLSNKRHWFYIKNY